MRPHSCSTSSSRAAVSWLSKPSTSPGRAPSNSPNCSNACSTLLVITPPKSNNTAVRVIGVVSAGPRTVSTVGMRAPTCPDGGYSQPCAGRDSDLKRGVCVLYTQQLNLTSSSNLCCGAAAASRGERRLVVADCRRVAVVRGWNPKGVHPQPGRDLHQVLFGRHRRVVAVLVCNEVPKRDAAHHCGQGA